MTVEWSADALADLDRFAAFLHQHFPQLAKSIAIELIDKINVLRVRPFLGRPLAGRRGYRQIILQARNAAYVVQYRIDGERLVILRVFHGREAR